MAIPEGKYANKLIVNGETLFDVSGDTITPDKLASGVTAHDKSGAPITGTSTKDSDTSDATAAASEILATKTAYVAGQKVTGTMTNNGSVTGTITTKAQEVSIATGFHDGGGKVSIDTDEQAKIVAANIRQGITILGVEGSMTGTEDVTAGSPTVTPTFTQQVITPNAQNDENYLAQVTVNAIPVTETENASGGYTITIG